MPTARPGFQEGVPKGKQCQDMQQEVAAMPAGKTSSDRDKANWSQSVTFVGEESLTCSPG